MKKFYYLSTCNTCQRILKELDLPAEVKLQDLKEFPLLEGDVDQLKELSGSYESLFSIRAKLYKERGLKNKDLSVYDYNSLLRALAQYAADIIGLKPGALNRLLVLQLKLEAIKERCTFKDPGAFCQTSWYPPW